MSLAEDPDNCGKCGTQCDAGAACIAGKCGTKPTDLAITAFAINATSMYASSEDGSIFTHSLIPADPNDDTTIVPPVLIARDQSNVTAIVLDGSHIYWVTTDCILRSLPLCEPRLHCRMRSEADLVVTIRRATPDDAEFIRQLSQVAFAEYDPGAARTTAAMMRESGAQTLLAVRGDHALGFVILRGQAPTLLALNAIAVAPPERGKRIGQRLMQATEQYAKAHGIGCITLSTAQANLAALDLFLRCGFVITDRTAVRYWRGQPACKLEKRIG